MFHFKFSKNDLRNSKGIIKAASLPAAIERVVTGKFEVVEATTEFVTVKRGNVKTTFQVKPVDMEGGKIENPHELTGAVYAIHHRNGQMTHLAETREIKKNVDAWGMRAVTIFSGFSCGGLAGITDNSGQYHTAI